jgi:hypothetical protein
MGRKPPRDELAANRDYWSRFLSFMTRGFKLETFDDRVSATYSNGTEILVLNSVHAAIIEQAEEKAMDHGFEQGYQDAMVNAVPSLERYHRSRTRKISKAV